MIKVTIPGRFAGMNEFIEANRTGKRNWNKANTVKQRDQAALLAILRPSLRGKRIKIRFTFPIASTSRLHAGTRTISPDTSTRFSRTPW